jgi:hypothetical protein
LAPRLSCPHASVASEALRILSLVGQRGVFEVLGVGHRVLGGEPLGDVQGAHGGERVRDDRQVRPDAGDIGHADRSQELRVVGDFAGLLVDCQVLNHQHRIVVADGLLSGPLASRGVAGETTLSPGA